MGLERIEKLDKQLVAAEAQAKGLEQQLEAAQSKVRDLGAEKEVVEIGDVIEGWRIVDITRRGIVIQKGERVVDLPIHEDEENEG